ncbi:methionyl-tRNA formyltransferase [Candidatus Saccharibacteria bacterium]|nr:methionyl-tRNA formyltransferase [Candidatus Saccharibacteria bacterium]
MTKTSNQIVFFGTEDFSLGALEALISAGYSIAAVVTKPDMPKGRGQNVVAPPVKILATAHNIPVWQPVRLSEMIEPLTSLQNPVGVLVSYGKIIPQRIIDLFSPGIINVHPSLLPKYRGPSPIETAILKGDTHTGVSIMQLSAAMDAGPIYTQLAVTTNGNESSEELYEQLGKIGSQLLIESLPEIVSGELKPTEQDHANATYCQLIQKSDGIIDWNKTGASIERQIRAYHQWPQSRAMIGPLEVIITDAQTYLTAKKAPGTVDITENELFIYASDIALRIKTLKPLGKKEMPVQAFLSGYRSQITN